MSESTTPVNAPSTSCGCSAPKTQSAQPAVAKPQGQAGAAPVPGSKGGKRNFKKQQ